MNARFTAFRRMKRNRDASKVAEAFFSASIIGISLIALNGKNLDLSNKISIFTIILSTFLLVLSLLFGSLNYDKRMDNYHSCGNELNRLYRLMHHDVEKLSDEEQKKKELGYLSQYHDIFDKYNLNHASFDYEYAMSILPDADIRPMRWLWLKIRYYLFDVYINSSLKNQ